MSTFDHIVVGAGAAGCALTRRLVDAGRRVLLLEAGLLKRHHSNVDSIGGFTNLWNSRADWCHQTTPQQGLSGRVVTINQGKLVGGSSAINAMMYVRCHQGDYQQLTDRGGHLWSREKLDAALARLENYVDGPAPGRYQSGLMCVRNCPDPRSYSAAFQAAAIELGFQADDWDYNGPVQEGGAGPLQFNIGLDGRRHSAFHAYLEPVLDSPLLTIEAGCRVHSLSISADGRVDGVHAQRHDQPLQTFHCSNDVVLAAGTLLTPQLLLRSGLGPAEDLRAAGVEVRQDLPAVGRNLMDHLQLPVIVRLKKPLPEPEILTGNVLFVNLNDNSPYGAPDLQLNFTPASPMPLQQFLPPLGGPVMIFLPILVQPRSIGEIRIQPDGSMMIDPRYLCDPADLHVLQKAVALVREFTATTAMAGLADQELAPGEQGLESYIRGNVSTLWHPVATCAMGSDPATSVVDAHLRVHGTAGLRICDASVTPYATAGNNHVPTLVLAEMASTLMLEDRHS